MSRLLRRALVAGGLFVAGSIVVTGAAGCGSDDKGTPPPWAVENGNSVPMPPPPGGAAAATPAAGTQAPVSGQATAPESDARAKTMAEVRQRKWKNEDFVEGDANRDPFHSFIADFSGGPTLETRPDYYIFFEKFSLDELKLAMITAPRGGGRTGSYKRLKNDPECDVRPCAMFIDGTGTGRPVSRNFHISKSDARVVRIDPEKGQVYVELKEDLGNGKSRLVERVLDMHPNAEGQNP